MGSITYTDELVAVQCGMCHIWFGIPRGMSRHREHDGALFCCPNGHRIGYGNDENTRLKAALDQAQADAAWERKRTERTRAELEAQRRTNIALKGHLTRWRKRIANGVCPVPGCKRHFSNVQAHVATEHPVWLEEHPEVFE